MSGWAAIPTDALRDPSLSVPAKVLFGLLASYANPDGTNSHPSHETLAAATGLSTRTVKRALTELRTYRLITWETRPAPNGRRNHYTVWTPSGLFGGSDTRDLTPPGVVTPETRPGSDTRTPIPRGGSDTRDPMGSDTRTPRPRTSRPRQTPVAITTAGDEPLDGMPEAPPSQPALTSQDIVRTYVDGWRTTHDQDPDLAILNRVRGSAKSLASTRTTPESWQAALSAARSAGAASRYDLIGALAPMPARYPEPEPDPEPSWMRRRLTP